MHRILKTLGELSTLSEMLEPSEPVKPGVEHVMLEIAPGVFRSQHRQRQRPAARLLRELAGIEQVRATVKTQFEQLQERVNERRRSHR